MFREPTQLPIQRVLRHSYLGYETVAFILVPWSRIRGTLPPSLRGP